MQQTTKLPVNNRPPKGIKVQNGSSLTEGMTNRSPKASDASTKPPSGSVNDGSVRMAPARTHSIGGRVA